MTTTTIIQIILGFLLVLIIKKFYYSIVNKKIDNDVEKKTETEAKVDEDKQKEVDKERYYLIKYQKDLEETLAKIEKIVYWSSYLDTIPKQKGEIERDYFEKNILQLAKKLLHFLDKEDRLGKEFDCFEHLLSSYYFEIPKLKINIENLSSLYRKDQLELQKKQDELLQKQQELELREARIIKIEASQKILNSELVEKINKEID
jgi:hypothetical protein